MNSDIESGFGIYIHFPFCLKKCDYCAFSTWDDRFDLVEPYLQALKLEITSWSKNMELAPTSIYFGGGTPSLMEAKQISPLLELFDIDKDVEITLECNPETVSVSKLVDFKNIGINRLSFGVQSFSSHVLASLGRIHSADNAIKAFGFAKEAGFENISLDLIYGASGESDQDWLYSLEKCFELKPTHLSAYALTVEPGTALSKDPLRYPDDDVQAKRYEVIDELAEKIGMRWYEISNWAFEGYESRHNQIYWSRKNYLGFGCSAHSYIDGQRRWNFSSLNKYLEASLYGRSLCCGKEDLTDKQNRLEVLMLGLRTKDGISLSDLFKLFPKLESIFFNSLDASLTELLEITQKRVRLTLKGRLLANEVINYLSSFESV